MKGTFATLNEAVNAVKKLSYETAGQLNLSREELQNQLKFAMENIETKRIVVFGNNAPIISFEIKKR